MSDDGSGDPDDVRDDIVDAIRMAAESALDDARSRVPRDTGLFRFHARGTAYSPTLPTPTSTADASPALLIGLLHGLDHDAAFYEVLGAWWMGYDFADVLELSGTTDLVRQQVRVRNEDDPDPSYLDDSTFRVTTIDLRDLVREDFR